MRSNIHFFLFGLVILLHGCCEPCEKPDYGEFPLSDAGINKMAFSALGPQVFVSPAGEKRTLTYFEAVEGLQEGTYDCDFDRRCGVCCASFDAGFFYSQLADADNTIRFEFALAKDFERHSPLEPNDSITEVLNIAYNSSVITDEIQDAPNSSFTGSVELNGRTFNNVRKISTDTPPFFNDPGAMVNFYFSYTQGIVGFQYADSTVWRLE